MKISRQRKTPLARSLATGSSGNSRASKLRSQATGLTNSLALEIHAQSGRTYIPFLRDHLLRAHAILKPKLTEMSLALVSDRLMSDLHLRFMNIAGPTDVLTFPLDQDARGVASSGEVVVCVPEATRRARESGIPVKNELLLYALHGMLHLCGFDDRTAADYRKMHRKEDQILTALGVGAVFHRESDNRSPKKHQRRGK